jgi:hypothetical protein
MSDDLANLRRMLKAAGYSPIPCEGKVPPLKEWDEKLNVTNDEIRLWGGLYQYATNTGILTKFAPAIDIDITNDVAAVAIEALVRERHEEHGKILVRFGRAPRRAILFRTDEPFAKIAANVIAPDGSQQKIELLASGRQIVVDGIHPDTKKPYGWHGGTPQQTPRGKLPYIREGDARELVEAAVDLLVCEFNYTRPPERPKKRAANGLGDPGGIADWSHLIDAIHSGRNLHESTLVLSAKLVASGMGQAAATNLIRGALERSQAPRDQRWQDRYDDVPRLVASMVAKTDQAKKHNGPNGAGQQCAEPHPLPDSLLPVASFDFELIPEQVRPWIVDICERIQCPPDYTGVSLMAALGSMIGRKVAIRPQSEDDWEVIGNQWALLIGRPGVLKSPTMEEVLKPLHRLSPSHWKNSRRRWPPTKRWQRWLSCVKRTPWKRLVKFFVRTAMLM